MIDTNKENPVRLTQMVSSSGCASKIFPFLLSDALNGINWYNNDRVMIEFSGFDDAGVYLLNDNQALIQTTDFFTPVVDDPYIFGQIAAANALSDVYAMGGTPISALNIVCFPQEEDLKILKEILRGGSDKAGEAKCPILGGHSIDIKNIVYGLAVTGTAEPDILKGNNTAQEGDSLILTKSLGTGLLNNAVKYNNPPKEYYDELIESMSRLNKNSSECMIKYQANACTDITGFGLAGHAYQMAKASKVVFHININDLPVLKGAFWAIDEKLLTRGDKSNRKYTENYVFQIGKINQIKEHLIYDPQTSGGLLISVPEKFSGDLIKELHDIGEIHSRIVGYVESPSDTYHSGSIIFHY